LGSDTGGSIRQPAALTGVVGLKPTYGRVSRYGLVAFASSLDQIGTFATDAVDSAILLSAIAGHDPRDSTSVDRPVPDYRSELERPLAATVRPLRIGYAAEYFGAGLDSQVAAAVRAALEVYRAAGAEVIEVHLPHMKYALACYYLIATAEASSNLARYDGVHYGHRVPQPRDYIDVYAASRQEGFGDEVKRRIMLGTYALSSGYYDAYYLKALQVRTLVKRDFDVAFERADLIASPVAPTTAFRLGEKSDDPLAMYLSDVYTLAVNLAGIPGISVPCGFDKQGLPIGLQLMGPAFSEPVLLRAAHHYQQLTDYHRRVPAGFAEQPSARA
jgi:aspartyl-tRNA(Asn)/glutamyl-tRNA(Gln) amidotransferase subunit A